MVQKFRSTHRCCHNHLFKYGSGAQVVKNVGLRLGQKYFFQTEADPDQKHLEIFRESCVAEKLGVFVGTASPNFIDV